MKKLTNRNLTLGIALGVLVPIGVLASNLSLPFTFTAGQPIRASEVNANFAALQNAVNAKADTSALPFASGTRLKLFGMRSTDGMTMQVGSYFLGPVFDSQLGMYCNARIASDWAWRCLPDPQWTSFPSQYFADSSCTVPLHTSEPPLSPGPGLPPHTAAYMAFNVFDADAGNGYVEVHGRTLHSTTVYQLDQTTGGCTSVASPGFPLYRAAAVVPPATFAQIDMVMF